MVPGLWDTDKRRMGRRGCPSVRFVAGRDGSAERKSQQDRSRPGPTRLAAAAAMAWAVSFSFRVVAGTRCRC